MRLAAARERKLAAPGWTRTVAGSGLGCLSRSPPGSLQSSMITFPRASATEHRLFAARKWEVMEESCLFCGCEDGLVKCPDCPALACPAHLPLHTSGGSCLPWCVGSAGPAGRGLFTTRPVQAGEVGVPGRSGLRLRNYQC